MKFHIYHNPRCSKSREALKLLQDAGVAIEVVDYLKAPPTAAQLDALATTLGVEPQQFMRFSEPVAKELNLRMEDIRSRAEWIALIQQHPILLERPIVVHGNKACVGRPPETVRSLLNSL